MAEIKIAGIMRAGIFSPNHIGNDAAIFNSVVEQLRKRGCEVNTYSEEQFCSGAVTEHIILNMCREMQSIHKLQECEDNGDLVINSGYGIENCIRERMARILIGTGIPYPQSLVVRTDEGIRDAMAANHMTRCWIKRGDSHTQHREDVTSVRHAEEAQEILQEFFLRGIKRAVINRHLEGDVVKFYGVLGTPFFLWFNPSEDNAARYWQPSQQPTHKTPDFDVEAFKASCIRAAETLDVRVYGGDAIIAPDGKFTLIDFDDWPSFAPCRTEAAQHIAKLTMKLIKEHLKNKR
jgi:hypothetical protein